MPSIQSATKGEAPRDRSARWRPAGFALLGIVAALLASIDTTISGNFYGLYLLAKPNGRPLELKDDLKLGDGPRLLAEMSFAPVRDLLVVPDSRDPHLDLDWDAKEGGGIVTNLLPDGRLVQTNFGRYVEDDGRHPHGLFVGGALPEVAAVPQQNESGMALRDRRGWRHIWCNVNEVLKDGATGRLIFPSDWSFVGSEVLVDAPDRVVIESEHEVALRDGRLRMERFAYFKAGWPFFRLGINYINLGDAPLTISYGYGDEPWVGEFGSAAGNLGWTAEGTVPLVASVDPRSHAYAGILDTKSGDANFADWSGGATPDFVYFGNHAGTPRPEEMGAPLASNEVFVGMEWRRRTIDPGETLGIKLTLGVAETRPGGRPTPPREALKVR